MEYISLFNVAMAVVIAVIIVIISVLKNPVVKAIVYGLPIPITLALIATQKPVDGSHVAGLFLLTGFLWITYFFRKKGMNIFLADILSSLIYIIAGYIFVVILSVKDQSLIFFIAYFFFWIIFIFFKRTATANGAKGKSVNIILKGITIFVTALALLTFKDVLGGFVVTFPFSGVFAVLEMRDDLEVLAVEFTKNSLAILLFFGIIYLLFSSVGMYISILIGWAIYFPALILIRKNIK